MDIGNGVSSAYANYLSSQTTASRLDGQIRKTDYTKSSDDELLAVCKEFEAYFVEQMFKAMQNMVPESSEEMSSSTRQLQDYYKEQMTHSFAKQSTESGGLGIAQMLYEQMKRNYGITDRDGTE